MPVPDFTPDEQYLIHSVKGRNLVESTNSYMWGYVVGGAVIAGFATYYESIPMLLTAFVIVCGFRIYEERFQMKWTPLWRSIFDKYEAALACNTPDGENNSGSAESGDG